MKRIILHTINGEPIRVPCNIMLESADSHNTLVKWIEKGKDDEAYELSIYVKESFMEINEAIQNTLQGKKSKSRLNI